MKILKQIQQGDVWIEKVDTIVGSIVSTKNNWGSTWGSVLRLDQLSNYLTDLNEKATFTHILAAGEATGHHHRLVLADGSLESEKPIKVDMDNGIFELMAKAILTHEEHKPLELDPGFYRFGIINEYDYESRRTRKVWD